MQTPTTCSICLSGLADTEQPETKELSCGHVFHLPCIQKWARQRLTCPECRGPFKADEVGLKEEDVVEASRQESFHPRILVVNFVRVDTTRWEESMPGMEFMPILLCPVPHLRRANRGS